MFEYVLLPLSNIHLRINTSVVLAAPLAEHFPCLLELIFFDLLLWVP
jgi:hypothetical protein